jgi:hypothetical protein
MPNTAHHSSSEGFVFLKHAHLASRAYPPQPGLASLTERPASVLSAPQPVAGAKGGHARGRGVVPEKGLLTQALKASAQPGAVGEGQSPPTLCSNGHRSQSRTLPPVKLIHTTSWLDPRVRAELTREAAERHLSLSEVVALACRDWVRYEIYRQQTSLFEAQIRHLIREEIQRLKDSLIPFEIKNATASEHTRIIATDVYKRILKAEGISTQRFYEIIDEADQMARNNIKARSPKLSAQVNDWQAPHAATAPAGKEAAN